jgi:peptide/nickel transport system substrate-binding protein
MAALNHEEALRIAVGPEDLWDANGAIYRDGQFWYNDAGVENYPSGDLEEAKRLAEEAGYNGEPIRFMVSSSYPLHHDTGTVFEQQMQNAGFNIDLQIYDWPTLVNRRAEPDLWDIFETTHGAMPDPVLYTFMNDNYPGWWVSPEKEELEARFTGTTDQEERQQIWTDLQGLLYEQVPVVKVGDVFTFDIASPQIEGMPEQQSMFWPVFWNAKKS